MEKDCSAYIEFARAQYANDDLEIDDNPATSVAEESGGVWVAAWVWVADAELGGDE